MAAGSRSVTRCWRCATTTRTVSSTAHAFASPRSTSRRASCARSTTSTGPSSIDFAYAEAGHLAHAYAMTIHKAQGATFERAFVLARAETFTAELGYTALSRATDGTNLYLDDAVTAPRRTLGNPRSPKRFNVSPRRCVARCVSRSPSTKGRPGCSRSPRCTPNATSCSASSDLARSTTLVDSPGSRTTSTSFGRRTAKRFAAARLSRTRARSRRPDQPAASSRAAPRHHTATRTHRRRRRALRAGARATSRSSTGN